MEENIKPNGKARKEKTGSYFFWITTVIEIIFLFILFFIYMQKSIDIYNKLGICLIILWIGILVAYYSWAVYFYNINYGLTDKDWEKIEAAKDAGNDVDEPGDNPNAEQTFGLPPGTVRGTIALTLLVGALAMIIVAFGKDSVLKDNETFVDNFQFLKTGFLMMIAFYFGNKSLEYLLPKNKADQTSATQGNSQTIDTSGTSVSQPADPKNVQPTDLTKNGAQG